MSVLKVWLLVLAGTYGGAAVWGTGAGVSPHMFNTQADCLKVAKKLEGVNAACVYTTIVIPKK